MSLTTQEKQQLMTTLERLSPAQQLWVQRIVIAFDVPKRFLRNESSDLITQLALDNIGDKLISHHANSNSSLSKDKFEYALDEAMNSSGAISELATSKTNRGHDITINGVPFALKTEAAKAIKENVIHVSKWMELGKGAWELEKLRNSFLGHLENYERILTLRFLSRDPAHIKYELVEIPKSLLLESRSCEFEVKEDSRQDIKPGYGYVRDAQGNLKYSLYFDGGSERKLQIKSLSKSHCIVHATWEFGSALGDQTLIG